MRTQWLKEKITYDGSQLTPLYNYLNHDLLGDSVVAWCGSCAVTFEHMIDGEDLKQKAQIAGDDMLHFVFELFDFPLSAAIAMQRLTGELVLKTLKSFGDSTKASQMVRVGDDLYFNEHKFNISIATASRTSSLIHFAVNITNAGTPVPTCSLQDFGVTDIEAFAEQCLAEIHEEFMGQKKAFVKVKTF
ncbi:MAG: DUF366 family protein [Bdellovibrionales bacterium]|nr:DUF366 family protein [Bdellovibrionales bacterium]